VRFPAAAQGLIRQAFTARLILIDGTRAGAEFVQLFEKFYRQVAE
jgi:hypothetical protein